MHLKFLARGTGSAAAAAAYLLAKRDAAGTERAAVEVLRGDPVEVARVADSLTFKYLYTSGVIAWSPEDAPTRAEIPEVAARSLIFPRIQSDLLPYPLRPCKPYRDNQLHTTDRLLSFAPSYA